MVHLHVEEGREDSELWIGSVRMGNGMVKVCSGRDRRPHQVIVVNELGSL